MLRTLAPSIDNGNFALPNPVTILSTGEAPVAGFHLHRNGQLATGGTCQLRQNGSNAVQGQITLANMEAIDHILVTYSKSPTTYRNIKHEQYWQAIYHHAMRLVSYVDKEGTLRQQSELTIPCRQCGLVLPFKLVTIDHSAAQKGNALDPIFKFFRALGLTNQDPSGPKGQTMSYMAGNVGGTFGGNGNYCLNPVGIIYFSLFRNSGYWNNLKALTLHNFLNLRPVCSFCNPSLGVH